MHRQREASLACLQHRHVQHFITFPHTWGRLTDFASTEVDGKILVNFCVPGGGGIGIWIAFVLQAVTMHSKQFGSSVLSCSVIIVRTKQGISRPTFILQKMNSRREKKEKE